MSVKKVEKLRTGSPRVRKAVRLYESGLSLSETADFLGSYQEKIRQILILAGVERRRFTKSEKFLKARKRQFELIDREILTDLYIRRQLSIKTVVRLLKTSRSVFYRSLDAYGIKIRKTRSPLTRKLLSDLYIEKELSPAQIADKLGYSISTVRERLTKYGLRIADRKNNQGKHRISGARRPGKSKSYRKLSDDQIRKLQAEKIAGVPVKELMAAYQISQQSAYRYLFLSLPDDADQ